MTSLHPVETIASNACSLVLRHLEGPEAKELFLHCQPPSHLTSADAQATAMYTAIYDTLHASGADAATLVSETTFLRDPALNLEPIRAARRQVLDTSKERVRCSTITEIEQPPINAQACLEILVHAIIPRGPALAPRTVKAVSDCDCIECGTTHGVRFQLGSQAIFQARDLYGTGNNAYEQTSAMFTLAQQLLQDAGMNFTDVVRTWIYLRHMERDYADFNRARREFFQARNLSMVPASTAIGGGPVSKVHDLSLAIIAVQDDGEVDRRVMTSPTLNEAPEYGADFVRGMRVREANKISLLVSGTASVDEAGNTAHVGDFAAQADRMLANLSALLAGQGATFEKVCAAISYVKHPRDAALLQQKFKAAGFTGFPNVMVEAPVCRTDLLCETELIAVTSQ